MDRLREEQAGKVGKHVASRRHILGQMKQVHDKKIWKPHRVPSVHHKELADTIYEIICPTHKTSISTSTKHSLLCERHHSWTRWNDLARKTFSSRTAHTGTSRRFRASIDWLLFPNQKSKVITSVIASIPVNNHLTGKELEEDPLQCQSKFTEERCRPCRHTNCYTR